MVASAQALTMAATPSSSTIQPAVDPLTPSLALAAPVSMSKQQRARLISSLVHEQQMDHAVNALVHAQRIVSTMPALFECMLTSCTPILVRYCPSLRRQPDVVQGTANLAAFLAAAEVLAKIPENVLQREAVAAAAALQAITFQAALLRTSEERLLHEDVAMTPSTSDVARALEMADGEVELLTVADYEAITPDPATGQKRPAQHEASDNEMMASSFAFEPSLACPMRPAVRPRHE